jgi:MFS family permease
LHFIENFPTVYIERILSGLFAAAVTSVALATIGDLAATQEARARYLTFLSLAGISGFFLGPMLGVFIARGASGMVPFVGPAGALTIPLAATAALAFLVAVAAAVTVPVSTRNDGALQRVEPSSGLNPWLVSMLFFLAFIVSAGVGVFEVGLALRGKQELGLTDPILDCNDVHRM